MHRLTDTTLRLWEEGPTWTGGLAMQLQTPTTGMDWGGGWPPALLALGAFITPSVHQERVCD